MSSDTKFVYHLFGDSHIDKIKHNDIKIIRSMQQARWD